ncbi:MAG: hypothetical protein Q9212_001339 [Teloschistes hypoglaucus]
MAKRLAASGDEDPYSKRRKLGHDGPPKAPIPEISSAKQLQELLVFRQDAGPDTRRNIQAFKKFLDATAYGEDVELQSSKRKILLEYLTHQPVAIDDARPTGSFDLITLWSFAAQSTNEHLYSAVTAVLALLLKTISRHVEFCDVGKAICSLILQREQLKVLEKGLSAQKTKDYIISPCLRLLTEVVSFDGGFFASRVYRSKDVTFKRLDTFLSLTPEKNEVGSSSRRKASIRDNALRYLLVNFKLQDHATKTEMLSHGNTVRSMLQNCREDPTWLVRELLKGLKEDILLDESMPRRVKARVFVDNVLGSIATLCYYRDNDQDASDDEQKSEKQQPIPESAHALLLSICTTPAYGILHKESRSSLNTKGEDDETLVEPIAYQSKPSLLSTRPQRRKTVRHTTISSFLQSLRPHANELQRDLVLATFEVTPELIPDYFHKKSTFSFEPKLTATWVGYAAFLLSTIQLPIEKQLATIIGHGSTLPSPGDMVDSILPLPLNSKVLTRCLNQSVGLIKFFAIQILNAAFRKLAYVVRWLKSSHPARNNVQDMTRTSAASALLDEFSQRCPDMNHVVVVFRGCSIDDTTLREASARLLALYYQHLPQKALEQKFDVSVALSADINGVVSSKSQPKEPGLESLVLEHLLKIASCSPDLRWWQSSGHNQRSLFMSGFQLCVTFKEDPIHDSLFELLQSALLEGLNLDPAHGRLLLVTLLTSLDSTQAWRPPDNVFVFVDDLLQRLAKKGVKYHQDLLTLADEIHAAAEDTTEAPLGTFLVVLMEQWPFVQKSATEIDLEGLSQWASRLFSILDGTRKVSKLSYHVHGSIKAVTTNQRCRKWLEESPDEGFGPVPMIPLEIPRSPNVPKAETSGTLTDDRAETGQVSIDAWNPPSPPPSEDENHTGLRKWKRLDVEDAVAMGAVAELMLCLCSQYGEIRNQALTEASSYNERGPLYLLAGELVETVKDSIADRPLPYFAGAIAAESCVVLANPLHMLYAKVNKFLNKGPTWNVEKLPSYWVEHVLMRLPTNDDDYYKEVSWLLDQLIDGLRTPEDMELYRRCHILERLLSLAASPSLPTPLQDKLFLFLFRCIYVGGSTTLVTRYSFLGWSSCWKASGNLSRSQTNMLEHLVQQCRDGCDFGRVNEWSGGMFSLSLDGKPDRTSPLVVRPARLPPTEEWMGPLPDPNQKKVPNRSKNDESSTQDGSSRRPIFERHMSRGSTNVPEDIVLGPPRTAFASAAGTRNSRTFDSQGRLNSGEDALKGDRQQNKDKYTRHGPRDDADGEGSYQSRAGNLQHRRSTNDHESWSGRQSRVTGQDDTERGARRYREQDRDKDGNPISKPARGFDSHRRDDDANDIRRNGYGRGRNEPSWYRDEKDGEADGKRDNTRARDWRDKNRASARGADLDWNQNTKPEVDPEWLDEPDVQEKQAHTAQDFERWKERMKAGSGPNQENAPPSGDKRPNHERTLSGLTSPAGKTKAETPLVIDPSMDGFFGQWNVPVKKESSTSDGVTQKAEAKSKTIKASKFTGFFGAKPLPAEPEPEVAPSPFIPPADSSTEDKEGFQRILKLLDQQQTNPQKDAGARDHVPRHVPASPAGHRAPSNLQSLLNPQPKNGGPIPPNKDSEFLLNLMRQSRETRANDPRRSGNAPPELLPFSNLIVSPQQTPAPPALPPGFPPEFMRGENHQHDKLNPTPTPDRKRPPPGLFSQPPDFAPSVISPNVPQRQGMMPPPGFQTPVRNPNQFPPGLLANMQSPGQTGGFNMRMATSNGLSMPPPGFTNNPPPGFSPMPMNQDNANRIFFRTGPPGPEGFGEAGMDYTFGQFRRQE